MDELKFKNIGVDKDLDALRIESLKESYVDEIPFMSKWSLNPDKIPFEYKGKKLEEDEEAYSKTLNFDNLVERRTKRSFKEKYEALQEADYIKIGNKIYPNTSEDFKNKSADQILADTERRYNQEQAEKEEEAKKAELRKKAEPILAEIKENLTGDPDKDLDVLFKHLVPSSGKAETVAGELVRAMMRILYRDYNDGDIFYDGYGKETCGSSAGYICEMFPEEFEADFIHIVENDLIEKEYTEALNEIAGKLVDYIMENPDLLATPNKDDSRLNFDEDYFDDYVVLHDYDCDISGDYIDKYLEYEKISWDDIEDAVSNFLQDLGIDSNKINRWAYDAINITDLTSSEYEAVEKEFPGFFDNYLEELESEFGSPYELEDEEEYEDDEEEEDEE